MLRSLYSCCSFPSSQSTFQLFCTCILMRLTITQWMIHILTFNSINFNYFRRFPFTSLSVSLSHEWRLHKFHPISHGIVIIVVVVVWLLVYEGHLRNWIVYTFNCQSELRQSVNQLFNFPSPNQFVCVCVCVWAREEGMVNPIIDSLTEITF